VKKLAEYTNTDLEKDRRSRKMPRWQLAIECHVHESTIERWEKGEVTPSPDDVDKVEKALKIPNLWYRWMRSHHDSFRERYPEIPYEDNDVAEKVVRMKYELSDITPGMIEKMERDSLDGSIDDKELRAQFRKEAGEATAAIQQVLDGIKDID
jgi:transcriptional regulator with XRE-family HTH domain